MKGHGRAQTIRNLLAERCGVIEVMDFLLVTYSTVRAAVINPPSGLPRRPKEVCVRGHLRPTRGHCPICHSITHNRWQRAQRALKGGKA